MKEELKEIIDLQNKIIEAQNKISEEKEKFEKNIEFEKIRIQCLEEKILSLKLNVEDAVLKIYKETKEKKHYGGIGVQERKVINYDEKKVFDWALDKKMFLSLDKKAFEKVADSLSDVPTVEISKKTLVTWPKTIKLED